MKHFTDLHICGQYLRAGCRLLVISHLIIILVLHEQRFPVLLCLNTVGHVVEIVIKNAFNGR
jgi:hypothetical protein